jgi:hypothetical protein
MARLTKRYIAGRGWRKYPALKIRTADGKGLFLHGETPVRRGRGMGPLGGAIIPISVGSGLRPHGTGFFQDIDKGFKKAGKDIKKGWDRGVRDTGRFLKSPAFKRVVREVRNVASPIVRKMIPELISRGADATALIPGVGPAIQPFAKALTPLATKGVLKGLDMGEELAKKHGYGSAIESVKYTKRQQGKQNQRRAMDMRDLNTFARVAQSAPMRGKGLRPL